MTKIVFAGLALVLLHASAGAQPLDASEIAKRVAGVMTAAKEIRKQPGKAQNVLLIIADDIGVEKSRCYDVGTDLPPMPNLGQLCKNGVVFDNMWSTPVCSSTRATIMTGRYGFRTGIGAQVNSRLGSGPIDLNEFTIARALNKNPQLGYAHALIGKWHLSEKPRDPLRMGWGHYAGLLRGGVRSYFNWPKTIDGKTTRSSNYITTEFIDDAIDWIGRQKSKPWVMWLALTAPHSPFHQPPRHLHSYQNLPRDQTGRKAKRALYNAMVEAMDTELGRLFLAIGPGGIANTNIIYVGDNGTAPRIADKPISAQKAKGTLYQGGIHVPMVISGPAVVDGGRRVKALVNTTDIFATILELAGVDLAKTLPPKSGEDSVSMVPYLKSATAKNIRKWAYTELFNAPRARTRRNSGQTIRDDAYKLIRLATGRKEFYHLFGDPHESRNLLGNLTAPQKARYKNLTRQMDALLTKKQTIAVTPSATSFENPLYRRSWIPGAADQSGRRMNGNEIMRLVGHKGKLYASTSMWMESQRGLGGAQVLVLDGPKAKWRIDHQFSAETLRLTSLESVTFTTDADGKPIDPVNLLLASPTRRSGAMVQVFSRDDDQGKWVAMDLGEAPARSQTRAIGFHHDAVLKTDLVFAGVSGNQRGGPSLGMLRGVYNPNAKGKLSWAQTPEIILPAGERFMGFTECNGQLYASSTKSIHRRKDGPDASWVSVFNAPDQKAPVGIRGLSCVPNPADVGGEDVLIFVTNSKVRRLDPAKAYAETVELDLPALLTQQLGHPVTFALAAYNEFVPYTLPGASEKIWMFGFESIYRRRYIEQNAPANLRLKPKFSGRNKPVTYFAAEARYLVRRMTTDGVRYQLGEIKDPADPVLTATRTIAASPFPGDGGGVLYMGGQDANSVRSHDAGWIYRVDLRSNN